MLALISCILWLSGVCQIAIFILTFVSKKSYKNISAYFKIFLEYKHIYSVKATTFRKGGQSNILYRGKNRKEIAVCQQWLYIVAVL